MAIYHIVDTKSGTSAIDRIPFFGHKTPPEIKPLGNVLQGVAKDTFRKALQLIAADLSGEEILHENYAALHDDLEEDVCLQMYGGLYSLIRLALRHAKHSLKQDAFKEDLKELKIPSECISDISSVVFGGKRAVFEQEILSSKPGVPSLESLRWKVDVTISTSVLSRVLEPTILMETTLSDGTVQQFEVPLSQFHELRYNTALLLKDMEMMERRSILKIQD